MNDSESLKRIAEVMVLLLRGLCPEQYEVWRKKEIEQREREIEAQRHEEEVRMKKIKLFEESGERPSNYGPRPWE